MMNLSGRSLQCCSHSCIHVAMATKHRRVKMWAIRYFGGGHQYIWNILQYSVSLRIYEEPTCCKNRKFHLLLIPAIFNDEANP